MLVPSCEQKYLRTHAVITKMTETRMRYAKRGLAWVLPKEIQDACQRMRPMVKRYQRGDKRHRLEEAQAEQTVGLWVINQHRRLGGAPEITDPPWESPWLKVSAR